MNVRYGSSVEPVYTDGRDIDPDVGTLLGEGASQEASGSSDEHIKQFAKPWNKLPQPEADDPSYYDRPMLNEPIWEWAIPLYYYVGGITGASLVLAAAAQAIDGEKFERLIDRCHWIALAGASLSAGLLIWDLGRPWRFFNMLRVFRPTSPMNVGAWILTGAAGNGSLALFFRRFDGGFRQAGNMFTMAAGVFGMGLSTYTGVLVANSAIPLWQESRRVLPVLFGSSAVASVGALFELFEAAKPERRITKLFGTVGQVAELAAAVAMEKQTSVVPRVGKPLKSGLSGFLWKSAAVLTAGSFLIGLLPNKTRKQRIAAGILGNLGSMVLRFTVQHAGVVSSRDARASFHLQRASNSTHKA